MYKNIRVHIAYQTLDPKSTHIIHVILYGPSKSTLLYHNKIILDAAGILNLMVIVLLATNFRLILENLLKYGILTHPTRWIFFLVSDSESSPGLSWVCF